MVITSQYNNGNCPECGGLVINEYEKGEITCQSCGLVLKERSIDLSHSGIRAFSTLEKNKKEQTGSPIDSLTPDICLSTIINAKEGTNANFKRVAKWHSHLNWKQKNMLMAITELRRIGSNLNFPKRVKDTVLELYKKTYDKELLRGRSIHGMLAACAYYCCKQEQLPVTFQELLKESNIDESLVKKCYKTLIKEFGLKSFHTEPTVLLPKYFSELELPFDIQRAITNLLQSYMKKNPTSGKDPKGICAGAIYLITKLKCSNISQKDISRVIGITEVTLRSRYKELLDGINFVFN